MELRQLRYLDAVVRHGGFTRAGDRLHVAQPAISAQVRKLEAELGVPLLQRTTRSVRLTTAGEEILTQARQVLELVDRMTEIAGAHRSTVAGHLRLGATDVTGDLDVPRALQRFRSAHPAVAVSLRSGLVGSLLRQLRDGELDVVIGPADARPADLRCAQVATESLVVITAAHDERRLTRLAQVQDDEFVCLEVTSGLRRLLVTAFADADLGDPHVSFTAATPGAIRELVAAGLGTAVIARSAVAGAGPQVRMHLLRDLPPHPPICVFRRRRPDPAADRFAATVLARVGGGQSASLSPA